MSESNRSCGNLAFFTEPDLASFLPVLLLPPHRPFIWQISPQVTGKKRRQGFTWPPETPFQDDDVIPQYLPISSMTHTQCILLSAQSNIRMNLWSSRIDTNTPPRGMPNACSQSRRTLMQQKNRFFTHFSSYAWLTFYRQNVISHLIH